MSHLETQEEPSGQKDCISKHEAGPRLTLTRKGKEVRVVCAVMEAGDNWVQLP